MARLRSHTALLAASCLAAFLRAAGDSLPSAWMTGIATNYGGAQDGMNPYNPSFGTLDGGCGYGLMDKSKYPYWSVAALSTQNSFFLAGPLDGCGECFEIQCINNGSQFQGRCNQDPNARSVTVMITDNCPQCESYHIDIQALTFNKIAPMANGRIDIQYRRVDCAPPAPMNVIVDENDGAGQWLRLEITTAAGTGSVQLVQIKGPNTDWESMNNYWGGAWEIAQSPETPLDLRIVSSDGSELTALGFLNANGQKAVIPTGMQFGYNVTGVTAITTFPGVSAMDDSSGGSQIAAAGTYQEATASAAATEGGSTPAAVSPPPAVSSSVVQITAFTFGDSSTSSGVSSNAIPTPPSPTSSSIPSATPSSASQGNQLVSAFEGPPTQSGPTPQSPTTPIWTPTPVPPVPTVPCTDTQPPNTGYSCSQQKMWGKCSEGWIADATPEYPEGYCMYSCGRC